MSKIKRLAGETVLYGLGSILPKALNFLLVPLHTKVFVPEEYGVITYLFAYVTFINIIYTFGMETAYFRFATKPGADEKRIFNLTQTVVVSISVTFSILFLVFIKPIAVLIHIPDKPDYILWLIAIMFIDSVVAIPFARLRLQKKPLLFALGKVLNIIILIGLNLYFLKIAFDPSIGIAFVFISNLIANAFYLIFFFKTLIKWRAAYDKFLSPSMFSYAYPVMLTGLAGMTNETFSRLTLEWWLPKNFYPGKSSEYALGVFAACYKFSVLMSLAVQSFKYAAEPFFFSNAAEKNSPALFAKVNHYFIITCCVILLGVSINMNIFKHFLGSEKYWEGLNIVPILLLGYIFLGVYYNLTVWFKLTDKTIYGTFIAYAGAIITIGANFILIPIWGYLGSSIATVVCYFVMTAACYLIGQKFYPIPYNVGRGLAYIVFTFILVYLINTIILDNPYIEFAFHTIVIGFYLFMVYLIERKDLKRTVV